jgi:hypothetical protein
MGPALGNMNAPCSTEALNGRQPLEIGERSGSDDNPVFHPATGGGPSGSLCPPWRSAHDRTVPAGSPARRLSPP